MSKITYTFAADCPVAPLRGITVTGGKFCRIDGKAGEPDAVRFIERVAGKTIIARIAGKPELEAALVAHNAGIAARKAMLDAIGWPQYKDVQSRYRNAQYAYERASEHGYPVEQAAKVRDAYAALEAARVQYPGAAAYAKAESYSMADNYAKAGAGRNAMAAIERGDDPAQAVAAMEIKWSADAERMAQNA